MSQTPRTSGIKGIIWESVPAKVSWAAKELKTQKYTLKRG